MAAGAILLDANGKVILRSDKTHLSDGAGDACCCAGCECPSSFAWYHADSVGSTPPYTYPSPAYSDTIEIGEACYDEIDIQGSSDDLVILMRPGDSISVSDTGSHVTITIPADCIILRNDASYGLNFMGTVYGTRDITVTDGTNTFTWYAADDELDNYIEDIEAAGFTTYPWGVFTPTTLAAHGLVGEGMIRFKFGWIGDDGFASVSAIYCEDYGI